MERSCFRMRRSVAGPLHDCRGSESASGRPGAIEHSKKLGYSISAALFRTKRCYMNRQIRSLPAALLPLLLTSPALCQNVNGTFTGVITDATGAVAPNASVTARNTGPPAAL